MKTLTDFIVWLLFVTTILATVVLIATGTYTILQGSIDGLYHFAGSSITLGIHYAIRKI